MQLGMNSNIERQGKTLHVQTEDSGRDYGHVITHLFLAGSIIETTRVDYDTSLPEADLKILVRTQHQKMLRAVMGGAFDKKLMLVKPSALSSSIPLARSRSSQGKSSPSSISQQTEIKADQTQHSSSTPPQVHMGGPWAVPMLKPSHHQDGLDDQKKESSD